MSDRIPSLMGQSFVSAAMMPFECLPTNCLDKKNWPPFFPSFKFRGRISRRRSRAISQEPSGNSTKLPNLSRLRRTRGIHFTQHRHCTGLLLRQDRSPSHGKNADKVNTATGFFCKCQKCLFSELHAPGGNFILLAPPCFNFKYMGRNGKTRAWRMLQRAATLLPSRTLLSRLE